MKTSRASRRRTEKTLRKIKVVPTDFKLTAAAGIGTALGTVLELFDQSPLATEFKKCLPLRSSHRSAGSYLLALMVIAGHIHGVRALRESLAPEFRPDKFVVDMDSTYQIHYGDQIEGVAYNYKNEWSLESQVAFNQLGFCHSVWLRPGNTKSGTHASEQMDLIFRDELNQLSRKRSGDYFFRADSAYCNQDVIKKCLSKGLFFTLTAHDGTTKWKSQLEETGIDWTPWEYSDEEILKASKRGKALPKIEVGRMHWQPSWSSNTLLFPIVMKRTWKTPKEDTVQGDLFAPDTIKNMGEWDYYAVVTNMDLSRWSLQQVLEHHAKRDNAENFAREEKYNFKLDGFPCSKLLANQAWTMLAMIGHNMIRWIALMDAPDKPHYSKKIRSKYLFVAGRLVSHAGSLILRVMKSTYERGLRTLREGWQFPGTNAARTFSTA